MSILKYTGSGSGSDKSNCSKITLMMPEGLKWNWEEGQAEGYLAGCQVSRWAVFCGCCQQLFVESWTRPRRCQDGRRDEVGEVGKWCVSEARESERED